MRLFRKILNEVFLKYFMQLGPNLKFQCSCCSEDICFSVTNISKVLVCQNCLLEYEFTEDLLDKLKKFVALCLQIQKSEDILGFSSIAVQVGQEKTIIPFNFLLTSFPVTLDLYLADKKLTIEFLMRLHDKELLKN